MSRPLCVHRMDPRYGEVADGSCCVCLTENLRASRDLNRYIFDLLPPVCDETCIKDGCQKDRAEDKVRELDEKLSQEKKRCLHIARKWAEVYPVQLFAPVTSEESGPLGDLGQRIAAQGARHLAHNIALDIEAGVLNDWPPCCPEKVPLNAIAFKNERDALLEMTTKLDEHPEGYEGPCLCQTCVTY